MAKPEHAGFGNKKTVQANPKPDPGAKPAQNTMDWAIAYREYLANLPQDKYE
jgi:hypothetical protein